MSNEEKTVLVVDDEPDVVVFLSTLLGDAGYRVITASDGEQAGQLVQQRAPDLITLDITMPEKSGVRFYREMKQDPATSHIPIIIVSGVAEDFEGFISSRRQVPPPEGYIHKPIDREALLDKARQLAAVD